MSQKPKSIFKSIKAFATEMVEAYKNGYMKGYNDVIQKSVNVVAQDTIYVPTEDETKKIINSMMHQNLIELYIDNLQSEITLLNNKVDLLIKNNVDNQELIISLMTTIEEMMHALEEEGILSSNDLDSYSKEDIMSLNSVDEKTDYPKDDVMKSTPKFTQTTKNSNSDFIVTKDDKKYTLN